MIVTVASIVSRDIILGETDVHLSYLPLPHVFERVFNHAFLAYGGTIWYFNFLIV
jgi:long-subunit acyl-CoA synthetase (AMP-forming)